MKSNITTISRCLVASFAVICGALAPLPAAAAEANCSILPQSFCKAATNETKGDLSSKNNAILMVLEWAIALLAGAIGVVAIGMFVYAGILYSSASGNAELVKKSKDTMIQTVVGLVAFAVLAVVVLWLIPGGVF